MTKKLESIFNLPERPDVMEDADVWTETYTDDEVKSLTNEALTNLEKIEEALPVVKGLENADKEFDELSDMAINSYKDLIDLGQQVDSRFSAEIFGVASNFMGHAITAKTNKIKAKLDRINLQLKKATIDQKAASKATEVANTPLGEGHMLDRNEILKMLQQKKD
jgi:hypothetical protein